MARSTPSPTPVRDGSSLSSGLVPRKTAEPEAVVWQELLCSSTWHVQAATRTRVGYLAVRLIALVVGAAVTVFAAVEAPSVRTAGLAAGRLRQHAFLYAAAVAHYADPATPRAGLSGVLREVANAENSSCTDTMLQTARPVGERQ